MIAAVLDTLLWAFAILYWPLLKGTPDVEILGQRLVWAAVFMGLIIVAAGKLEHFVALARNRRQLLLLTGAALAITFNWAGIIWGANHGHVVEASLGLFIGPLTNVVFGIAFLREAVSRWQWVAVGIAVAAVLVTTVDYGHMPWYALMLAISGGFYGLFKKLAHAGALESLALETMVIFPFALAFVIAYAATGNSTFTTEGSGHAALLVGAGLVTVAPLVFFGYAATRVPLVTLGLVGYLAPVTVFLLGITYFGESMGAVEWAGFVLIWGALIVFASDSVIRGHRTRGSVQDAFV